MADPATNYPGTNDTFATLDGSNDILSDHPNARGNAVEAVQSFVGSIGSGLTLADTIDLLDMFRKARQSFRLTWSDVDTITVSQGEIVCTNATVTQRVPRKNTTTTDITFADIDTGSRATDTTYYVHAVADASANTVTFVISLSATAPTGVTRFGLIGKFATNSTGAGEIIETSVSSFVGEVCVQTKSESNSDLASDTTHIPDDDSIPQITEGTEFLLIPFLPTDAANVIEVHVNVNGGGSSDEYAIVALFKEGTNDALKASRNRAQHAHQSNFIYRMNAGVTELINFSVRAGIQTGTFHFNGNNAGIRRMGGVMASSITVKEYRKVYR